MTVKWSEILLRKRYSNFRKFAGVSLWTRSRYYLDMHVVTSQKCQEIPSALNKLVTILCCTYLVKAVEDD